MSEMILSAGLFTGEAVEEFVCFNEIEVEVRKAIREQAERQMKEILNRGEAVPEEFEVPPLIEPRGAYFTLLPIDGDLDADYTKRRGQDTHSLRLRPKQKGESGPNVQFDAMEISISNEQEIKALQWLAKKVVKGWRGIMLDDGRALEFTPHNLEKISSIPSLIRPVIQKAYDLGKIKDTMLEGNS